ncbi:MAG: alpha-D-ribose 1-methylphosphonate 5-triphosphate diphosphatase [Solirubrobacterales bacterium]
MSGHSLDVALVPGGGRAALFNACVTVDDDGVVTAIEPVAANGARAERLLAPPVTDLHLDVLRERRRPRADVEIEQERAISMLDAELAASGYATVCVCARFEDAPEKGVRLADTRQLCELIECHAERLGCEWLLHARVEVTDEGVVDEFERALARSRRIALVSVMDHSAERSRFHSVEAHRQYYSRDWSLPLAEVDGVIERKRAGAAGAAERRRAVAALALAHGVPLASHDDRDGSDVLDSASLGARVAEFPLSLEAAMAAKERGITVVLGAPNAVRGRSTSPSNLTVAEAVAADACDVLCSDYLPSAMLAAPFALAAGGQRELGAGFELVSGAPAGVLGREAPRIDVGRPLDAVLIEMLGDTPVAVARWRQGRLVWSRSRTVGVASLI